MDQIAMTEIAEDASLQEIARLNDTIDRMFSEVQVLGWAWAMASPHDESGIMLSCAEDVSKLLDQWRAQ